MTGFFSSPISTNQICSSTLSSSIELDQILWVDLIAVKYNVYLWVGHIVHAAVVEVGEASILGGRPAVHGMTDRVFANKHSGEEHGFVGRLVGKYRRSESVPLQGGVVFPGCVAEFTGIFGVSGEVAPCRKEN